MSYPVKWFHSGMAGAPQMTAAVGAILSLLEACLIDGFNLQTLDSLTYDSGSGECTGTVAAGHGFVADQVILVAGANEAGYNGEHRVTWVDTTRFRFTPETAPSVTPATGTLTAKAAPVGNWEKAFAGTNVAAYRSTDPQATGCLARIDDSNTATGWNTNGANAAFSGVESMTDIDTLDGEYGVGWIRKHEQSSGSTARNWALVADGLLWYLATYPDDGTDPASGTVYAFGDLVSHRPGDAYQALVCFGQNTTYAYKCTNNFMRLDTDAQFALARAYTQAPGAITAYRRGNHKSAYLGYGGFPYPNPADNGLLIHGRLLVEEVASGAVRGRLPGVAQPLHTVPVAHLSRVGDTVNDPAALYLALSAGYSLGQSVEAQAFFDLAGPWR